METNSFKVFIWESSISAVPLPNTEAYLEPSQKLGLLQQKAPSSLFGYVLNMRLQ